MRHDHVGMVVMTDTVWPQPADQPCLRNEDPVLNLLDFPSK